MTCRQCESNKKENEDVAYDYRDVPGFTWALEIVCPNSNHESFFVCTVCDKQRRRMTKQLQLRRHDKIHNSIPCNTASISYNIASTEPTFSNNKSLEEKNVGESETIELQDNDMLSLGEEQIHQEVNIVNWNHPLKKRTYYSILNNATTIFWKKRLVWV